MTGAVLVVAKSPVPGLVKTRLARSVGPEQAARLASAALLDTLETCAAAVPPAARFLALRGALDAAVGADRIRSELRGWRVFAQRGADFGHRLVDAHRQVHAALPSTGHAPPVVQVGMDTPQVTREALRAAAARASAAGRPALGPAEDGGWWVLASTAPVDVEGLELVPMSCPETGPRTRAVLCRNAGGVVDVPPLRDVDDVHDAQAVALACPGLRFAAAWREIATTGGLWHGPVAGGRVRATARG